jgi:hypothetical protein
MKLRFLASFLAISSIVEGGNLAPEIPSLDEMAGDWLPRSVVTNLPDVHNFNQMVIVNRDLTSFFCNPGGLFARSPDPTIQWRAGYPLVRLSIDGVEYPATDSRWSAYRALRRNRDCGGLAVETDTRMVNEARGVLCRITVSNPTQVAREFHVSLRVPGTLDRDGIGVVNAVQTTRTTSALQPALKPDQTEVQGNDVIWHWRLKLAAGATGQLGFVAGDNPNDQVAETRRRVADWAAHFDAEMAAFQSVWEQRWRDAFTPGNRHFSGNLPILKTDDAALRRNYYMGALTMLILERTQFPISRAFVTSGERGDGIQYYWDASMQATAWALLEPEGMKQALRRWLTQNPRGSPHLMLRDASGFDAKHYDAISGYAANACTMFQTADVYLRVTGDRTFLHDRLENGKTVLESLRALATDWESLPKGPDGLVNYGGNGKLLETAPLYVECVASVNAQNVWMMREAADWETGDGNAAAAAELRQKADQFLPAVLALYNPESGAWNLRRMDGTVVPVRHCFDYIYVANALASDLTPAQKAGMNNFVKRELLTRDWMRAMSLSDPDVPRAVRPDHSYTGAYDGWIPLTVAALWRLGDSKDAYAFYCRTADVTKEGPFAQAHEFYGPNPTSNAAPVRIALRGANMKECISGAAFADVAINTFFGFRPSVDGKKVLVDELIPRSFSGTMQNIRQGNSLYTISADAQGLKLIPQ